MNLKKGFLDWGTNKGSSCFLLIFSQCGANGRKPIRRFGPSFQLEASVFWFQNESSCIVPRLELKTQPRRRIFSRVRPFYEQAVSDLDRSMHKSQWA
jgi:hypothetical protein